MVDQELTYQLIGEIMRESTLNSAAQSVIDKIKRDYDDVCTSGFGLDLFREDLTLIVRVLNENLREQIVNRSQMPRFISVDENDDNSPATSPNNSLALNDVARYNQFDENGHVLPYVDFQEFNKAIEVDKHLLESFEHELNSLQLN
jgi:hypothetical protein